MPVAKSRWDGQSQLPSAPPFVVAIPASTTRQAKRLRSGLIYGPIRVWPIAKGLHKPADLFLVDGQAVDGRRAGAGGCRGRTDQRLTLIQDQ